MRKFQFRLDSLVRLREAVRDERRAQLAEAMRIQASLEGEMQQLRLKLDEARQMHTAPRGAVDIDRLLVAERYEMVLLVEKLQIETQQASMNAEVEKRRQALVWADQDVRVLEKLREVDVTGIEPTAHTNPVHNVFRADVDRPGLGTEAALANAPRAANQLFLVPKVIE